jgi:hypothetical protein
MADHFLAQVVSRVGLTGEYELDGPFGVEEQRLQPVGLGKQERSPLVGGEPAGETDGEEGRVQGLVRPGGVDRGRALFHERRLQL